MESRRGLVGSTHNNTASAFRKHETNSLKLLKPELVDLRNCLWAGVV